MTEETKELEAAPLACPECGFGMWNMRAGGEVFAVCKAEQHGKRYAPLSATDSQIARDTLPEASPTALCMSDYSRRVSGYVDRRVRSIAGVDGLYGRLPMDNERSDIRWAWEAVKRKGRDIRRIVCLKRLSGIEASLKRQAGCTFPEPAQE